MKGKGGIIAGIITLVIGGTVYTVSQEDIVNNLSRDTGMTQEQAQKYVENVSEDELISYDELGEELIADGEQILAAAAQADCENYYYDWETDSMPCEEGVSQLRELGRSEVALGNAYKVLDTDSATRDDISNVIRLIDRLNGNFRLEIVRVMLDSATIEEYRNTNSFNKAMLQAALESE